MEVRFYESVGPKGKGETFGMLFFAEITAFEEELHSEIEKLILTNGPVESWTYPLIQPLLMKETERWLHSREMESLKSLKN